jgi:hypothetical protein
MWLTFYALFLAGAIYRRGDWVIAGAEEASVSLTLATRISIEVILESQSPRIKISMNISR